MEEHRHGEEFDLNNRSHFHSPLCICGASTNNLKSVNVMIPWNQTTVLTGPSGSGKSSLAFDTIFAEGQRQYIESLSLFSRQFVNQLPRPELESISGLQPVVAIKQNSSEPRPRSIVATLAEIYDFLRLLYARVGVAHCYKCGRPIQRQTTEEIAHAIMNLPVGTRFILLAPIVRDKRGSHSDVIQKLIKTGKTRARIDGRLVELANVPDLDPNEKHTIEAVVDRLILRDNIQERLLTSLDLAIKEGADFVCCLYEKERQTTDSGNTRSVWKDMLFSTRYSCPKCSISYTELEPRSFSFNSPFGACPHCGGLGRIETFLPESLVAEPEKTLAEGALSIGKGLSVSTQRKIRSFIEAFELIEPEIVKVPIANWDRQIQELFFYGSPRDEENSSYLINLDDSFYNTPTDAEACVDDEIDLNDAAEPYDEDHALLSKMDKMASVRKRFIDSDINDEEYSDSLNGEASFIGLIEILQQVYSNSKSVRERKYLSSFRGIAVCHECGGTRIRRDARAVTIGGKRLNETLAMTVTKAISWFETLQFDDLHLQIASPIIEQIVFRLKTMVQLKIGYLTLDRSADSLSGGELQRVRLTTALGNNLSGVCYILDEPTTGLHPQDSCRLLEAFDTLKAKGNTILLVEHQEDVIRAADWVVDFGPEAGDKGGSIIATGSPEEIAKVSDSPTGRFLSGRDSISVPNKRRKNNKTRSIVIDEIQTNNLRNVTLTLPLGLLVCVTGVSGSGKSSLLNDTLVPALQKRLRGTQGIPYAVTDAEKNCRFKSMRGANRIDKLVVVTQEPIGRSARSNPATYSGVFDEIRRLFASTRDAKAHGFKAGRFSFNIAGGRCEECQGLGVVKIDNLFIPDAYVTCPICEGKRFNQQTLQVRFNNRTIADVLDMSFDEAERFFSKQPVLSRYIQSFREVGLGYLKLGQPATNLSGGEAQRVKLATELARVETGNTLYVLDEPTSGLHFQDIKRLMTILSRLVELGNSVVMIEHSVDVMKVSDWIIDMGPGGGIDGGLIIATGTPEDIATLSDNATGQALRRVLNPQQCNNL